MAKKYSRWDAGCCCKKRECSECTDSGIFRCPPQTSAILYFGPYDAERFAEIKAQTDGIYWMPIFYDGVVNGKDRYHMEPANFPGWVITFGRGSSMITIYECGYNSYQSILDGTGNYWWRGTLVDENGPCDGIEFQKCINLVRDHIRNSGPKRYLEPIIYAVIILQRPAADNNLYDYNISVYMLGNLCRDNFPSGSDPANSTYLIAMITLCADEDGNLLINTPKTDLAIIPAAWVTSFWNYQDRNGNKDPLLTSCSAGIVYDPSSTYAHEWEDGFTEVFPSSTPWRQDCILYSGQSCSGTLLESRTEKEEQYYIPYGHNYIRYTLSNNITAQYSLVPDILAMHREEMMRDSPNSIFQNPYIVKKLYKEFEMQFAFNEEYPSSFPPGPINGYPGNMIPLVAYANSDQFAFSSPIVVRAAVGVDEVCENVCLVDIFTNVITDWMYVPSREEVFEWLHECMDNICTAPGKLMLVTAIIGHDYGGVNQGRTYGNQTALASAPAVMNANTLNIEQISPEEPVQTLTVNDLLNENCQYAHDTGDQWISNVSCTAIECSHPNGPSLGIYSSSMRWPEDSEGNFLTDSGIILVRSKYCNSQYCQNYQKNELK
ncbi:MAG: hypothetical protein Q4G69_00800 [Planctomycetia bacterium]|nr:hypothetical protein [Planctomycetia bacterium]